MVEKTVLDFLNETLDVPVYLEKPPSPPEEYVLFERLSGGMNNHISNCTIAIQSYAASMFKACELNEKVKKAMDRIIVLDDISNATLNSDYNFTDTTKKGYRYQAVYSLVYFD